MGKKTKKDRVEKRDSYAAKRDRTKRRNTAIAGAILAAVGIIVGVSAYNFATMDSSAPGTPPGAGLLGDEHEHASILVRIFGDPFDFSGPSFQIQNSWIHFEAQDGTTIHRHSTGVTMGYLFDTLDISIDGDCYVFPDGREFCTNEDYTLRYHVNGEEVESINDYVLEDGDRILITYGSETPEVIQQYLDELGRQPIIA